MQKIRSSCFFPLALVFIFLNLLVTEQGGTNPMSRFAMMEAIVQDQSFQIDPYKHWTQDLAQDKSGHFYSNKAPGPALLAVPVYALWRVFRPATDSSTPSYGIKTVIAFLYQVIPFAMVVILLTAFLQSQYFLSHQSLLFLSLALFFGNTAGLFMNSYFGHGITSLFVLLSGWFFLKRDYFKVGLFMALAQLSEYAALLILFPLLISILLQEKGKWSWIKPLLLGSALPLLLWCWYHTLAFGLPWSTAVQNQVAEFRTEDLLWGLFSLPKLPILSELLWGTRRGLLWTVPWLLLAFALLPLWAKKFPQWQAFFFWVFSSLGLLLLSNSTFNGWHAGASPGPRYLCIAFPLVALSLALVFDQLHPKLQKLFWILLAVTIVFRGQVYVTTILAPHEEPIWVWQWQTILAKNNATPWVRLLAFYLFLGLGLWGVAKRCGWPLWKKSIQRLEERECH